MSNLGTVFRGRRLAGSDVQCTSKVKAFANIVSETPSTGLRHPSFKEEGAGKRCSECDSLIDLSKADFANIARRLDCI